MTNDENIKLLIDNNIMIKQIIKVNIDTKSIKDNIVLFTNDELKEICDKLPNAQDKFLVYSIFNNILGNKEVLNLKIDDISSDKSYINIGEKRIICDEYMVKILKETLNEIEVKRKKNNRPVNMKSRFIIKKDIYRPYSESKPMTTAAIYTKFKRIFKDYPHFINPTILRISGIIYKMYLKEKDDLIEWNIENVKLYLDMNGIDCDAEKIYRCYQIKYHNKK